MFCYYEFSPDKFSFEYDGYKNKLLLFNDVCIYVYL